MDYPFKINRGVNKNKKDKEPPEQDRVPKKSKNSIS